MRSTGCAVQYWGIHLNFSEKFVQLTSEVQGNRILYLTHCNSKGKYIDLFVVSQTLKENNNNNNNDKNIRDIFIISEVERQITKQILVSKPVQPQRQNNTNKPQKYQLTV